MDKSEREERHVNMIEYVNKARHFITHNHDEAYIMRAYTYVMNDSFE